MDQPMTRRENRLMATARYSQPSWAWICVMSVRQLSLGAAGEHIGKNTVALLMQRAGIVPKTVRKFRVTTDSRKTVPAPNRLEREFVAKHPNQRWVSGITFIPTRQGWLYLAVIIDLYSRAVIGWAMHKRMGTELVTDALRMALMRQKVRRSLLLHSDQGS